MLKTDAHVTFWVWWDERWQGVRLAPGESVTFDQRGPTDEGWSSATEVYTRTECGGFVELDFYSDGCDCDGRMSTESHEVCPVSDLEALPGRDDLPARPKWQRVSNSQRDYTAEAMGY